MKTPKIKPSISFPITIWFVPETGNIHIRRPSEPSFDAEIAPRQSKVSLTPSLYDSLFRLLVDAGQVRYDPPHEVRPH